MNKAELIREMAEKTGFTLKDAGLALDAFMETVTEALKNDEKIQISGFGTYEVKAKEAREGINPKTGEKIKIPATRTPVFKFGKAYKEQF